VVVANLNEAGEREILAQRISFKTIVGQQPAHIGMTGERNAIEVIGFALEPVGPWEYGDNGRNRRIFRDFDLDPDAPVKLWGQEVIDHVETTPTPRPVDGRDVDEAPELAALVFAQKCCNLNDIL